MQIDMGIIKLEVSLPEATRAIEEFKQNRIKAFEAIATEVREAVGGAVSQLLQAEMTLFLGRPDQEKNKRNGYEEREYALKGVGAIRIRMPVAAVWIFSPSESASWTASSDLKDSSGRLSQRQSPRAAGFTRSGML